jgi:hypothetical protein
MAMPGMFLFCSFALVQRLAPLSLQCPLAQLFPTAGAGGTGQSSDYLSLMSMGITRKKNLNKWFWVLPKCFLF